MALRLANYVYIFLFSTLLLISCDETTKKESENYPEKPGFDREGSDLKAIQIADQMMVAMGGYDNYKKIRFLSFNFFGVRQLYWDIKTGRIRVINVSLKKDHVYNVKTKTGTVRVDGQEVKNPKKIESYNNGAYNNFINDVYWLLLPFKLKDGGVTLQYLGEETIKDGVSADKIQLTFKKVGLTPQNKYIIYVDKNDHLIKKWDYYKDKNDPKPMGSWVFDNYKRHKGVLFSSDRSDGLGPKKLKIYDELPDELFENLDFDPEKELK